VPGEADPPTGGVPARCRTVKFGSLSLGCEGGAFRLSGFRILHDWMP